MCTTQTAGGNRAAGGNERKEWGGEVFSAAGEIWERTGATQANATTKQTRRGLQMLNRDTFLRRPQTNTPVTHMTGLTCMR